MKYKLHILFLEVIAKRRMQKIHSRHRANLSHPHQENLNLVHHVEADYLQGNLIFLTQIMFKSFQMTILSIQL